MILTHSVLFTLVNIRKDMVLRALNLYVMIKFYFISCIGVCFIHFCLYLQCITHLFFVLKALRHRPATKALKAVVLEAVL